MRISDWSSEVLFRSDHAASHWQQRSPPTHTEAISPSIMKSCFVALLCITSLAACGKRAVPGEVFAKSSDPQRIGMTAPDSCSPLPAKVVLGFPYRLQSDFYYSNVLQAVRRRVVLQYLDKIGRAH